MPNFSLSTMELFRSFDVEADFNKLVAKIASWQARSFSVVFFPSLTDCEDRVDIFSKPTRDVLLETFLQNCRTFEEEPSGLPALSITSTLDPIDGFMKEW